MHGMQTGSIGGGGELPISLANPCLQEDEGDATYETAEEEDGGGGITMQRFSADQSPRLGSFSKGAVQLQATPAAAELAPLAEYAVSGPAPMHRRSASDAGVLRLPTGDEVEDVDRAIVSSIRTTRMELLAKPVQEGTAALSAFEPNLTT